MPRARVDHELLEQLLPKSSDIWVVHIRVVDCLNYDYEGEVLDGCPVHAFAHRDQADAYLRLPHPRDWIGRSPFRYLKGNDEDNAKIKHYTRFPAHALRDWLLESEIVPPSLPKAYQWHIHFWHAWWTKESPKWNAAQHVALWEIFHSIDLYAIRKVGLSD